MLYTQIARVGIHRSVLCAEYIPTQLHVVGGPVVAVDAEHDAALVVVAFAGLLAVARNDTSFRNIAD